MTSTDGPRLPAHLVPIVVTEPRPPRPLTHHQAAGRLGMHARTLDRWIPQCELATHRPESRAPVAGRRSSRHSK